MTKEGQKRDRRRRGEEKVRRTYIDNTRWIVVVLVVIYHVIYMFNGVQTFGVIGPFSDHQPQDIYQYIVYPWFMLLLFTISGMSARYYLEGHTDKEFIASRTRKLLVPSTIGLLVFGWATGYYNTVIGGGFGDVSKTPFIIRYLILCVSGIGVLWYIQLLWVFCIVLVLIRKIENDKLYNICEKVNVPILIALTLLVYGGAQILNTPIVIVYRFGIYGVGFLIGYFALSHDEVMERVGNSWILLTALAVVSCVVFTVMFWGKAIYAEHVVLDTLMCNIYAWLGTLGVLAFMKKWGGFTNPFSEWMCRMSWGLYVFHYLFIAMVGWNLHVYAPTMPPIFVYLLTAIAGFGGAFALYAIMSRIPVIRWCVLGIAGEGKKHEPRGSKQETGRRKRR